MKLRMLLCLLSLLFLSRVCPAKTTLVVWDLLPGAGSDAQVAEFEWRNPHIKISRGWMSGTRDLQKPLNVIAAGTVPDVVCQGDFVLGIQATLDSYMPLDKFIAEDRNDPNGIHASDYYTGAWQKAKYRGRVYAIPYYADARLLFYNRKLLLQSGFKRPAQSWGELLAYAKKLTKRRPDGSYERIGFIPDYGDSGLYLHSWQNGGEFLSRDGRRCTLNHKYSVEALQFMTKIYDELGGYEKISRFERSFQGGKRDPFFTGQVAMMITGNWYLRNIAQHMRGLDFGVAPAPVPAARLRGAERFKGQPKFITWSVGPYWAILKGARHPKEAWRFIKWMNSAEAMLIGATALQKYHKARHEPFVFGTTANRKTNEALLRRFPPPGRHVAHAQKAFIELLRYTKFRPVTFATQKLWDAQDRAFQKAVRHQKTPQAALDEQTRLVQKELDKFFRK